MKCWEVFRFELTYQLRQRATWLYAVAVPALAFYVMKNFILTAQENGVPINAPINIDNVIFLTTLFGLLVTAALAGDAATRDVQTRMAPLLYTAPQRERTHIAGRFLATFVLNAALLALAPIAALLAIMGFGGDPALMGPFRLAAYVQPYLFFTLPNVFVSAALLFTAALLGRRALASYVAAATLFVATMFTWMLVAQVLQQWDLAVYLDPLGMSAVSFLVKSWTQAERSTLLIPFEGALVWNRLLWLGIAAAVLVYAHHRFHFAHHAPQRKRLRFGRTRARVNDAADAASTPHTAIAVPHVARAFGFATRVRQTLAVAGRSFREIMASRGWILPVGVSVVVVIAGPELMEYLGVPLLPATSRVIDVLSALELQRLVVALTVLYAGELVWKERDAGLHAIADATPVPDGVLLGGKLLGLGLGVVAFQALLMATGIAIQARMGYYDVEPGLYARILFGFQLTDYLLFAVLAVVVHVLVNQKYVGHLVVILAYVFTLFAGMLGIEHRLLVYGSDVGWAYSELSGFGPAVGPWLLFKLYWAGCALLLALAARLFWVRGVEHGLRDRLRSARRRLTRPALGTAALGAALVLTTGGFIFYNTNVVNDYHDADARAARRAAYERRYGRYERAAQPRVAGTKLHVEIYPGERTVAVRGTYRLVNRSGTPIDTLHVATAAEAETGALDFGRPAEAVVVDDDLGHRIYALAEPLGPGASLTMRFEVRFAPRGFTNDGAGASVAAGATHFEGSDWLPAVGYQPDRELARVGDRLTHGLPPRPEAPPLHDAAARYDVSGRERIDFEATVGTDAGQVALAPGTLRRTWIEGGRRYFHYAPDAPIRNGYAIFSAAYAAHTSRWNEVDIEIFHHPDHTLNIDRMVRSVRVSLEQFTRRFGPYPYRQIRLVEAPGAGIGLRAHPINIRYWEGFSFLNAAEDYRDVDLPFAVVAHEVAHQWWGNQLSPAYVEGAPLLSESLAWYSTFGVVEEAYGEQHLLRLLALFREAYLTPRPQGAVPLIRAADWFAGYRKGPFAMYALRAYVGEDRVDAALRRLFERHRTGEPPLPTSLDLLAELRAVTPDSLGPLLTDLFERNTFWELKTKRATAAPAGEGRWRVTLDVSAQKVEVDSAGVRTEHPMDEPIEIGVYAAGDEEPLYLQMHRIHTGARTITVTVPREPARAGVDPRHLLIDTKPADNTAEVGREVGTDGGDWASAP